MFRSLKINQKEDEFKAVLYKNRREPLCEIPNEYIESIEYKLRDCFVMTLSVPSKIQYRGKTIDNPLFDKFKPKRQIIVNDTDRYEICGDFKIESNKNIKKKKFTAKSFEANLSKKDIAVNEGTFQLYKTDGDKIDVEEGILNWLENETSWKVGYVDVNAKKTTGLFDEIINIDLYNNLNVLDVQVDKLLFDKEVSINIPNQVLNFSIKYNNIVSTDSKSNIKKTENYEHNFENFAEGIKHIKAFYSIDDSYNTVIRYEFTLINGFIKKEIQQFTYLQDLDVNFQDIVLSYKTGNKVEKTKTKYRSFEKGVHQWLPFLRDMVEQAFDCIFQFDTVNKLVNVYDRQTMGNDNGFYLYYDQYLMKIDRSLQTDDIVTRLIVEGKDGLSINGVNPLGTNYIEDFNYLLKQGNISNNLQNALIRYKEYTNNVFNKWNTYKQEKDNWNKQSVYLESKLKLVTDQLNVKKSIKISYVKIGEAISKEQKTEFDKIEKEIKQLNKDTNELIKNLKLLKDKIKVLDIKMNECNANLKKRKATDENGKIFTEEDINELDECIYSLRLSDDYYTDEKELLENATKVLKERNTLPIKFTTNVVGLTKHPRGWKNIIKLGDLAHIIDGEEEIDCDDVRIVGFKYIPNKQNSSSKIESVEFNNSKFVLYDLKTIRNISINKINRASNALNKYKNIWVDNSIATSNFKKIQRLGLHTNNIPVRCNETINELDITSTGVWCTDKTDTSTNNQFYMGSGVIAVTDDDWTSCKTVADEKGLVARSIIGTAILGERMKMENPQSTIKIDGNGISVFDKKGKKKVQVGIYEDNVNSYKYGLLVYDEDGNVVINADGMQRYNIITYLDEVAPKFPMECPIYLYKDMEVTDAKLFLHLSKYRANSTTISDSNNTKEKFTYLGGTVRTKENTEHATITKEDIDKLLNGDISNIELKHTHINENHMHGIPGATSGGGEGSNYDIAETTMPEDVKVYVNDKLIAQNINTDMVIKIKDINKYNSMNVIKITSSKHGRIHAVLNLKYFANF